jgi:5'(3')-deoxyribonucleotidase
MRKVFVDIDNTLGNLTAHYLSWYNSFYNTDLSVDNKTLFTYDIPSTTGTDHEEETRRFIQIFNSPGFWLNEPLFPDAADALELLNNKYEVYLLTTPSWKSTYYFPERLKWIENKLPFMDYHRTIFCQNKGIFLSKSILIDDFHENLAKFRGKTIRSVWGYNEDCLSNRSFDPVDEWSLVPDMVKQVCQLF